MKQKVYSVFDIKAGTYSAPHPCVSRGVAMRSFETEVNNPASMLNKYPKDFVLYEIAEFDDCTGAYIPLPDGYVNLGTADDYFNKCLHNVVKEDVQNDVKEDIQ